MRLSAGIVRIHRVDGKKCGCTSKGALFSCEEWAVRSVLRGGTCVDGARNQPGANGYHDQLKKQRTEGQTVVAISRKREGWKRVNEQR